ncbi:MAG: hypothetical protein WC852_07865 [Candidatus Nanoarchaeia archaeon]|jgi:hypothetical protein
MKYYSRKMYFIIAILVACLSIAYMIVPVSECVNQIFEPLGMHWDVCSNLTFTQNLIYVILEAIMVLGSAYLIIAGIMYLKYEQ